MAQSSIQDFSFIDLNLSEDIKYFHSTILPRVSITQVRMLLRLLAIVSLAVKHIHAISPSAVALNKSAASVQAASTDNEGLVTEGVATLDGLKLDAIAEVHFGIPPTRQGSRLQLGVE
ncbi:hypothetical protein IMSHALPRED_003129 [Imshaugia aleurites]|uniref:Uncharacterized protein n=1 Tax=Imshaugia aleurites TaxID=172621 RepID=A0A8H3PJN8_9LECA|nr:hypothetical protein IMSHALPRED_003129 [Imshaugia aleurites]